MNQIQCIEHEKTILLVCLESDCRSNRVICQKCLNNHVSHLDELVDLQTMQVTNDARLLKITQGKEKLKELLEETKELFPTTLQQFQAELQDKEQPQNIQQASLDELQEIIQKNLKQKNESQTQTARPPPEAQKECCFKWLSKNAKKAQKQIGIGFVAALLIAIILSYICSNKQIPEQIQTYQNEISLIVTSNTLGKTFTFDPQIQNSCKIKITPKSSMSLLGLVQGTQVENLESRLVYTIHQEQSNDGSNKKRTGNQNTEYDIYGRKINGSYYVVKQEEIYIPQTRNQKIQQVNFNHKVQLKGGVNYVLIIESSRRNKEQFYGFELNSQSKGIETTCTMVNQLLIELY